MREIYLLEFDASGQGLPSVTVRSKKDLEKTIRMTIGQYAKKGWTVKSVRISKGIRQDIVWETVENRTL